MKSLTFFYAYDGNPAHVVIDRDGSEFRYRKLKGKVSVRLHKDGHGATLRQFRVVEDLARIAAARGVKVAFKPSSYPFTL